RIAGALEPDAAPELVERRDTPHIGLAKRRARERGHSRRKRLRRRYALAWRRSVNGHAPLLHACDGHARRTVENEKFAALCRLDDGWNPPRSGRHVEKHRLRPEVIIPKIMVGRLEDPPPPSGLDVERHQRTGYLVVDRTTLPAIMIGCRIARRDINQAELVVIRHLGPAIGCRPGIDFARWRRADPVRGSDVIRP